MNQQEATKIISDLLESASKQIETALSLGREHNVPVNLGKLGITDDMWYVTEVEYREQYIENEYYPRTEAELTPEELESVKEAIEQITLNHGYDGDFKVVGWMSSSTNC